MIMIELVSRETLWPDLRWPEAPAFRGRYKLREEAAEAIAPLPLLRRKGRTTQSWSLSLNLDAIVVLHTTQAETDIAYVPGRMGFDRCFW